MDKITLFEFESPDITISMIAYFNEENQLVFSGQDIGEKVRKIWGESEYEYLYKVDFAEVKKIAALFQTSVNDRMAFLQELKNRFYESNAYSKFGAFMKENDIVFSKFIW